MATTVNTAFNTFLNSEINIEKEQTNKARNSRDFKKEKIKNFDDFFTLYGEKISILDLLQRKQRLQT